MPEGELPVGRLLDIARALGRARDKGIGHRKIAGDNPPAPAVSPMRP
jgi:hypothetical protein